MLRPLLEAERIYKCGVGISDDVKLLRHAAPDIDYQCGSSACPRLTSLMSPATLLHLPHVLPASALRAISMAAPDKHISRGHKCASGWPSPSTCEPARQPTCRFENSKLLTLSTRTHTEDELFNQSCL